MTQVDLLTYIHFNWKLQLGLSVDLLLVLFNKLLDLLWFSYFEYFLVNQTVQSLDVVHQVHPLFQHLIGPPSYVSLRSNF